MLKQEEAASKGQGWAAPRLPLAMQGPRPRTRASKTGSDAPPHLAYAARQSVAMSPSALRSACTGASRSALPSAKRPMRSLTCCVCVRFLCVDVGVCAGRGAKAGGGHWGGGAGRLMARQNSRAGTRAAAGAAQCCAMHEGRVFSGRGRGGDESGPQRSENGARGTRRIAAPDSLRARARECAHASLSSQASQPSAHG